MSSFPGIGKITCTVGTFRRATEGELNMIMLGSRWSDMGNNVPSETQFQVENYRCCTSPSSYPWVAGPVMVLRAPLGSFSAGEPIRAVARPAYFCLQPITLTRTGILSAQTMSGQLPVEVGTAWPSSCLDWCAARGEGPQ